jgi:hypothetical protein
MKRSRHRLAGGLVLLGAGGGFGVAERQAGGRLLDAAQHVERRLHHLVADSVSGQYGNVESGIG